MPNPRRSPPGPRQRREGQRSRIPKMLRRAQARACRLLMHKTLPPTNARSHLYERGSLNKAPKKAQSSPLHILCPPPLARSLPCSAIKVCLRLWGNFAGYISTSHTAHTLLHYISSIKTCIRCFSKHYGTNRAQSAETCCVAFNSPRGTRSINSQGRDSKVW